MDEDTGEPCLKKRVLAQREAAQQALANMRESSVKQGSGSKTTSTALGNDGAPPTENTPILPIPPYCLPSGDADLHSTSLPNNIHGICHAEHTIGDSIIAGSQFGGVIDTPVTTYENFTQGLPTKPNPKAPPKPKKKKAPATMSKPPSSTDSTADRLGAYIDMSQAQIGLIRSQFMSIAQTMTAIQNWMGTGDISKQKRVPDANPNNPAYDISVTVNSTLPNASNQPPSQPTTHQPNAMSGNPLSTSPTNSDTNVCNSGTSSANAMPKSAISNVQNVQPGAYTTVNHLTAGPTGSNIAQPPSGSSQYDVVLNGYPTAKQPLYPPAARTGHMAESSGTVRNHISAYRTPIMSTRINRGHGSSHRGSNRYMPHLGHIHDIHNIHNNTYRPPAPSSNMGPLNSTPLSQGMGNTHNNSMNQPPAYHTPPYPTTYTYDVHSGHNLPWPSFQTYNMNNTYPDPYTYLINSGRPNERKIISGGMPIGWAVDRDIKERIWADLYVDFSELVQREDRSRRTVTVDSDSGTTVSVQKQAKEIKTIKEWDHAFAIYMNIYMELESNERNIPHLVTYGQELKAMAENGLDFIAYDINFRKERESQVKAGYPPWNWNVFRQETFNHLQMTAIAEKLHLAPKAWSEPQSFKSPFSTSYFSGNNPKYNKFGSDTKPFLKVPPGFCYEFHSQESNCVKPTCSFRHNCPCGRGPHTIYNCRTNGHPYRKRGNYGSRGRGGKSNSDHFKQ